MKRLIISNEQLITVVLWLIIFCVQTTDIKIGFIKISEFLLLLLTPIVFLKSANRFFVYFFTFFTLELFLAFLLTYNHEFAHLGKSLLKSPYFITIGRYLELITCLTLGSITYKLLQQNKYKSNEIISRFVNINVNIALCFALIYLLVVIGILPISKSVIVYADYRLKGFYVEGGPYGLMLSFIFMLTIFLEKSRWRLRKRVFLACVIIFMAKSKAGTISLLLWLFIQNFSYLRSRFKAVFYPLMAIILIGFLFVSIKISYMYVDVLEKTKKEVHLRPQDPNLIMGRVSGFSIASNMVMENPIFGIGLGNYPMIRNNKEYRGFFPLPPKEIRDADASGLGGIVDILVDMGIIGLCLFGFIIFLISINLKNKNKGIILLFGFLTLFLFGVQLYFPYPWVFLGIILAYKNNYIDEISN